MQSLHTNRYVCVKFFKIPGEGSHVIIVRLAQWADQARFRTGADSERQAAAAYNEGDGLFRIYFFILPMTCISQALQSNLSVSRSFPFTSVIGSARTWP